MTEVLLYPSLDSTPFGKLDRYKTASLPLGDTSIINKLIHYRLTILLDNNSIYKLRSKL